MNRLPAEWEPQDAVLLTWPHQDTDWGPLLNEVHHTYQIIVDQLLEYSDVLIAVTSRLLTSLQTELDKRARTKPFRAYLYPVEYNDTWTRDHGPLSVATESGFILYDFTFNGWGEKFPNHLDNRVTQKLAQLDAFGATPLQTEALVLEGGAIDSDGNGCILTTSRCLLNPNRNPSMGKLDIETSFKQNFGVEKIHWLDHGYLAGDDTDCHIDMLARFAPSATITYVHCDDPDDEHYQELSLMHSELSALRDIQGKPYSLIPLPMPQAIIDEDGQRLPATYANYLITNGAVLVPTYRDARDNRALSQIATAFPGRDIIGIDSLPLIKQHGSLHCVTMQIPQGIIKPRH